MSSSLPPGLSPPPVRRSAFSSLAMDAVVDLVVDVVVVVDSRERGQGGSFICLPCASTSKSTATDTSTHFAAASAALDFQSEQNLPA